MIKRKLSKEHRQAIIKANTGRIKSKEEREKISKALMGHPITEKVREAFRKAGKERFGEKNPSWKGGIRMYKSSSGRTEKKYIYLGKRKYEAEHRIVMENSLKRKILSTEIIHHLNGDGLDNRIENLKLFSSQSEHVIEEQRLNYFAKKILYGNLAEHLKDELLNIYKTFNVK